VITLENMYFADEIRPTKGIAPSKRVRVDKRELEMAKTLIERFTTSFDHTRYKDEYRDRLLRVVKQKQAGKDIHAPPPEERDAPADILEALRASVEAAKGSTTNGRRKGTPKRRTAKSKR
jgi:DNA end-binding protein Ku